MMLTDTEQAKVERVAVTQADRDAAADLATCRQDACHPFSEDENVCSIGAEFVRAGEDDAGDTVQAFARHRLGAIAAELSHKA